MIEKVMVRMPDDLKALIDASAKRLYQRRSDWIREACRDRLLRENGEPPAVEQPIESDEE